MIKLSLSNNIKIIGYGATIQMNKAEYAVLNGEWRHGISLLSCINIEIYGLYLNESGGDGIYISGRCRLGEYSFKGPMVRQSIQARNLNNLREKPCG